VKLSALSRCGDLHTVEGAATGGLSGACINRPPETVVDRTLYLLPPVAVTAGATTP
jgi:hypothetical protein